MNGGSGLIAYIAPSTSSMSGAWVCRATCIATWAHGLPNPWNTVSAGRMVRASATTNHSSIVQLIANSSCQASVDSDQRASAASRAAPTASR